MAVQLTALALLVRVAQLPVPLATVLAVEAALLHNFAWHQRWTWRDRPASHRGEVFQRLGRFHACNGIVSLVGNVIITAALAGLGVDPILANVAAIAACSTINFFAGDRLVFRGAAAVTVLTLLHPAAPVRAGDDSMMLVAGPAASTVAAWDKHIAEIDARYRRTPTDRFFALDAARAAKWRERAKAGEVPLADLDPPGAPSGKIHHWAGAIYIPNTTVDAVVKRLQDYAGRESEFYQEVKASKLIAREGDNLKVYLKIERSIKGVTAIYNTEHAVEYRRLGAARASSRSVATKIAELENANGPEEREKAQGKDRGYLWRLHAYWRFEQSGDGVLIECESASLSRDIPWGFGWLVKALTGDLAKESLAGTLRSMKKFLKG